MIDLDRLQGRLGPALAANVPGGPAHVLIALPSFSVGESTLAHYASRIPALEHRYLNAIYILDRIEHCEFVFLCSKAPDPEIVDYSISLMPPERRESARARFRCVVVPDESPRPLAQKLLDRPDILADLKASIGDRPALIEPWNVTEAEVEVARRLAIPINGTGPDLWPLGFKSSGRRLFRTAGVPIPFGVEDVHTIDDVVEAIATIRSARPTAPGVVVKHDNSGAGDGNVVIRFDGETASPAGPRDRIAGLPAWYLADLHAGGIVEELVAGERFTSPSSQIDIAPDGEVRVLATHEQVLGGEDGQVYMGCRFPADPAYAAELARHATAVGHELAQAGVRGRSSVDFAAVQDERGRWAIYALEVNIRKGGTTHPYAVLRNLVPGRYDADSGQWRLADGTVRTYSSSDNLVDPDWYGLAPSAVIGAVADAGLQFDPATGRGVTLHMLSGLAIDGRFGATAIGTTPDDAQALYEGTRDAVDRLVAGRQPA